MRAFPGPLLSVVVPVYNEERRLPATLVGLAYALRGVGSGTEIVVVDNASTDRSAEVVRAHQAGPVPVRMIECAERGKGAAVRAGVLATSSPFVGFCDADLATNMDALTPTLDLLHNGVNVVVGSRAHPMSDVRARHSVLRQVGAFAFRRAVGSLVPGVGDTQCGFKFFDRVTARAVFEPMRTTGFAFDVELLARAQQVGAAITEIPVRWTDVPGSTFSPMRDGVRSFTALREIRDLLAREAAPARLAPVLGEPIAEVA